MEKKARGPAFKKRTPAEKPLAKPKTEAAVMAASAEAKQSKYKKPPRKPQKSKLAVNLRLSEELVMAIDQLAEEKAEGNRSLAITKLLKGEWKLQLGNN